MSDTIKYEKITSRSIADMTVQAGKTSRSQRATNKHEGSLWSNMSGYMEDNIDFSQLSGMETKKEVMKAIKDKMHPALLESLGETKVTWSSDDRTQAICKYFGDVAKIVLAGQVEAWLPGDDTCAPRNAILAECKGEKSSLEKFKIAIANAEQAGVEGKDAMDAISAMYDLATNLTVMLDATQQDTVRGIFSSLGK